MSQIRDWTPDTSVDQVAKECCYEQGLLLRALSAAPFLEMIQACKSNDCSWDEAKYLNDANALTMAPFNQSFYLIITERGREVLRRFDEMMAAVTDAPRPEAGQ